MTDIRPGIYKIGNLQIIMFSDEMIGVATPSFVTDAEIARVKDYLKPHFPNAKVLFVGQGEASYHDLLSDADFRQAVEAIALDVVGKLLK